MITHELSNGRRLGLGIMSLGFAGMAASAAGLITDWKWAAVVFCACIPFVLPGLRDLFFDTLEWGLRLRRGPQPNRAAETPQPEMLQVPLDPGPVAPAPTRHIPVRSNGHVYSLEVAASPAMIEKAANERAWKQLVIAHLHKGTLYENGYTKARLVGKGPGFLYNDNEAFTAANQVMIANGLLFKDDTRKGRMALCPDVNVAETCIAIRLGELTLAGIDGPPPAANIGSVE